MGEPASLPQEQGDLQFDRAEPVEGTADVFACAFCAMPLFSTYYEVNGKTACEPCRERAEQESGGGAGAGGFLRAALAGCAAAALGSGLYYGVRAVTGYEIGFVSIIVGVLVGGAVRWGTKGRGGRAYQVLAVFLTYMAIASTYLPAVVQQIQKDVKSHDAKVHADTLAGKPAPPPSRLESLPKSVGFLLGIAFIFVFLAAMPILVGFKSPIFLLIVGFGLWEAWKINRRRALAITGPLQVGAAPQPSPAG
jgi:hypothetical protein